MPILSIIMPVFNAEKTLHKAVYSVINQRFRDWELLLVNDGSSDSSGQICDFFSDSYANIKSFHQENRGLSSARNTGISNSSGMYLAFLDSDDWVETEHYRSLIDAAKHGLPGLVMSGYVREFHRNGLCRKKLTVAFDDRMLELYAELPEFLRSPSSYNLFIHVWNKLYRLDVLERAGLRFDESLDFAEDVPFNVNYLREIGRVRMIAGESYHYICKNQGNLTARWSEDLIEANGRTWRVIRDFLREQFQSPEQTLADDMYLRGCFLNLEKALSAGQTYGQLAAAIRRTRLCPETREILMTPPCVPASSAEFLLYRFFLERMPDFLIYAAVCLRRGIKRGVGRL